MGANIQHGRRNSSISEGIDGPSGSFARDMNENVADTRMSIPNFKFIGCDQEDVEVLDRTNMLSMSWVGYQQGEEITWLPRQRASYEDEWTPHEDFNE